MKWLCETCLLAVLALCVLAVSTKTDKPNIVFIFADDLGWNDVSLHGSDQIITPNIDLLGCSGVILNRYYTHAICTPSRSAFLTGKYSYKIGMQGEPLSMSEDRGIPLSETLLPQYFKAAGYATHLVGKWHVGLSRNKFLPTARGFDSYFGHRGGYTDYYEYTVDANLTTVGEVSGLSLHRNNDPAWDVNGYLTDVYTTEVASIIEHHDTSRPLFLMVAHNAPHASNSAATLQAPPGEVREMRHVELTSRRLFAAVVKKLDDSVGDIVNHLHNKGILKNTIIVFVSDNGGMTTGFLKNYASNYPMRGIKMTPFEGGVRVVGLIWSSSLNNTDHFYDGYMHVTDWMPTLLSAAGINVPSNISGVNQWHSINTNNEHSPRNTMYEIDDYTGYGSITLGEYKLVTGEVTKSYSTYQGAELRGIIGKAPSYKKAVVKSKVYKILASLGREVDVSKVHKLRNKTIIDCNINTNSINMCHPSNGTVCLYNIIEDPCETTDLSEDHPDLVTKMKILLEEEAATRIPRIVPAVNDPLSNPRRFNYTWTPWISD